MNKCLLTCFFPIPFVSYLAPSFFSRLAESYGYQLQVEMLDSESTFKRAKYNTFKVAADPPFVLTLNEFEADETNFVRDAFGSVNGKAFAKNVSANVCPVEDAVTGWIE